MSRYQNLSSILRIALVPIFVFAVVNAVVCWFAAWVFWERYEFSVTCLGFGCRGIVIALSSYLYVLTSELRSSKRDGPD